MLGITLEELYEMRERSFNYFDGWKKNFILDFAKIYTCFDNFNDALNYVIAVVSKDKTYMPSVVVGNGEKNEHKQSANKSYMRSMQ